MTNILPKSFRFSWKISLVALILIPLMLWASSWQWERYLYKVALLEEYASHDAAPPLELTGDEFDRQDLVHKKVKIRGEFDLERQFIVINRRHKTGSGYWLLAPLKISSSDKTVIVGRGFIPFADRAPETWKKYDLQGVQEFEAVVQENVSRRTIFSPKNPKRKNEEFIFKWLYPELSAIAKQLPYPIIENYFLQKLGGPETGVFPAESVTFKVPPSTHFGYTIEWILLAIATFVISFLLQAFPRTKPTSPKKKPSRANFQTGNKEIH